MMMGNLWGRYSERTLQRKVKYLEDIGVLVSTAEYNETYTAENGERYKPTTKWYRVNAAKVIEYADLLDKYIKEKFEQVNSSCYTQIGMELAKGAGFIVPLTESKSYIHPNVIKVFGELEQENLTSLKDKTFARAVEQSFVQSLSMESKGGEPRKGLERGKKTRVLFPVPQNESMQIGKGIEREKLVKKTKIFI
jgi:hypothetical protein